jgi:elongator complex protein 3
MLIKAVLFGRSMIELKEVSDVRPLRPGARLRKPVRTRSGVTPLTVVAMPYPCPHGRCTYCPVGEKAPQSYTDESPAIKRVAKMDFDVTQQIKTRLHMFDCMGHPTSKIELIFLGGTFLAYPKGYQEKFVKDCYDALNGVVSPTLEAAQTANETAAHRCVALCIETKPDWAMQPHIDEALRFGATRIELGVQLPDDEIYRKTNRGHTVQDVITSTRLLKDAGYKVGYHVMPGLPGSNAEKDLRLFEMLCTNPDFLPDQLKIYPCQVVEGTPLARQWKNGEFMPYDEQALIALLAKMKRFVPQYCRIMRTMRQFHPEQVLAGKYKSDLRTAAQRWLAEHNLKCSCIRCREIGFHKKADPKTALDVVEYAASGGREFFIQAVNKDNVLFGLCRARIPGQPWRPEITKGTLIIRELHVYGQELDVSAAGASTQHKGLGKRLMQKAEDIAKANNCTKIAVISGIGVRDYYRKLGYAKEGAYMVKAV